jgi:hypothetical protein
MEPSKAVLEDQCFRDFFPISNKKYKSIYDDLRNIGDYDWNSYLNLFDADQRKNKNYCKRKCYNQRFSPGKYKNKNLYPIKEELLEFIQLMDADPTDDKKNCIWTIEHKGQLLNLDVKDVNKNIKLFQDNYPTKALPPTYEELLFDVEKTIYSSKGKTIKEKDIMVLYDGKDGKLIVPLTVEASCKYGKGTKWCTAATESQNYFEYYQESGPLYIWITKPDKKKFQFHFEKFEFADMLDEPLKTEDILYFRNKHPVISQLFKDRERELLNEYLINKTLYIDNNTFFYYYAHLLNGEWPRLEKIILENPKIQEDFKQNFKFYVEDSIDKIKYLNEKVVKDSELLDMNEEYDLKGLINFSEVLRFLNTIQERLKIDLGKDINSNIQKYFDMIKETSIYNTWNEIKDRDINEINRIHRSVTWDDEYLYEEDRDMLLNIQSVMLSLKNMIAKIPQVSFSNELEIYLRKIDQILRYNNY